MKKVVEYAVIGFFVAIVAAIIFVQAGKAGGKSGGEQSADIINATGSALSNTAKGLQGAG